MPRAVDQRRRIRAERRRARSARAPYSSREDQSEQTDFGRIQDGLDAGLRSARQSLAFHSVRRDSHHRIARWPGVLQHRRTLGRDTRAGKRAVHRDRRLRHAYSDGRRRCTQWRVVRPAADRMDRAEHHLPLSTHEAERLLPDPAGQYRQRERRSPRAAAPDRVRLRRVLRRRSGIRDAGGGDRRHIDRLGLLSARRFGPVFDREHRAGRLWRARHAGDHARGRDRPGCQRPLRDGRASASVLLAAGSVLADLGFRGLARNDRDMAGDSRHRCQLRHPAVSDFQLPRPDAGRRGFGRGIHGLPCRLPEVLEAEADLDYHCAQGSREGQRDCRRRTDKVRAASHRRDHPRVDPVVRS